MKLVAFLLVVLSSPIPARAAKAKTIKLDDYTSSGVITGGTSGTGFSLLRATRLKRAGGVEALAIAFGDAQGEALAGDPGYFHIQVDDKNRRISIDLAQMQVTAIEPDQLRRMFGASRLVASTEMTMDPIDVATNISLKLRAPAEARARIESRGGARILVLEMRAKGGGG